ncbi:MAG: prepilin peptidase [Phycisphaeraceae bacterium]|nr:hypothetical protein [Phycisphaerales bacterium]MCB9859579.1 prepilin peptidase [Phycisphaeraceae bacterium]
MHAPSAPSPLDLPVRSKHDGSDRLWQSLSKPFVREQPLTGLDKVAQRARGRFSRTTSTGKLRQRATVIDADARRLRALSEGGLDQHVLQVKEAAITRRDDADAIDAAYAAITEVVRRQIGLELHIEQIMGALVLASGRAAEMATGEGKTVTAILPAALDGWSRKGVHVCTVNDYLAQRDAHICSPAYSRLGLTVGVLLDSTKQENRRRAYEADITYAADKQLIFDFLRDRLRSPVSARLAPLLATQITSERALDPLGLDLTDRLHDELGESDTNIDWDKRVVQRGLYAAIVDEADSVLIDEAITPAIISLPAGEGAETETVQFPIAAQLAQMLIRDEHYTIDERFRRVQLTSAGRDRIAECSGMLPAFWRGPRRREELLVQALSAREIFHQGDDYIIRNDDICIVDRSTGRVLEGRQWQLGLHQAVQAKEGLEVTAANRTSARISYQQFFQRYQRLSGMSGTLWEVAPELWEYYQLPITKVPTHKPVIRRELADRVHLSEEDKFTAVANRVEELHATGQPVLVGTRSVESSEKLGAALSQRNITCTILNATREAEEAAIVKNAGQPGAVTVATNMAGRGTDIHLTDETRELGGLVVIGTERHDERRVDRQLFGRSGRQGDPGVAEMHVCLDDLLIKQHGPKPLIWMCRRQLKRGIGNTWLTKLLWQIAQRSASARAVTMRTEQAKTEAWLDLAMHSMTK